MNKLDFKPLSSIASHSDPDPAPCLIVLVPEAEVDTTATARKIWELANALKCHVQFIGLSEDTIHEPGLRRQLATLSALVRDDRIHVESKIEFGANWLKAVKSNLRKGDVIACFEEQQTGFARRPLSQILESNLNATIYVFSGLQYPGGLHSGWPINAMAWAGSIAILAGFFWMQVKITQLPGDWVHSTLIYLSIPIEVGLIWGWNTLFP